MKKHRVILLLTLLAIVVTCLLIPPTRRGLQQQQISAIRQTVLQSAAQCYAVEGVYPKNIAYLEDHYGLILNHRRYIITYDAFASNLPPQVAVLVRGEEGSKAP